MVNSAEAFGAVLEARGFEQAGEDAWRGLVDVDGTDIAHVVQMTPDFPFSPPRATPDPRLDGPLWHLELDGALCLYPETGETGRPWENPAAFIDKVADWHRQTREGWPDDPGDLDLDRYFRKGGRQLVVFDDLEALIGRRLELKHPRPDVIEVERGSKLVPIPGTRTKKSQRKARASKGMWGAAVDLGILDLPVSSWETLSPRISGDERRALTQLADSRPEGVLLAKYGRNTRGGVVTGAVALLIERTPGGTPRTSALEVEDRPAARRHRAGTEAPALAAKSVAVIGVGAVGSFVAEGLARAGIGRLTLVDGERLRYGNTARHLADPAKVGTKKAQAVREILVARSLMDARDVRAVTERLTPADAVDVLSAHDLVVDSTANTRVGDAIAHFADDLGIEWVKAGVHRGGAVVRVDRFGPGTTPDDRRPPRVRSLEGQVAYRESGCGDPVSPTAPSAVERAATLACAFVIDTLTRRRRARHYKDTVVETISRHDAPDGNYGDTGMVQG